MPPTSKLCLICGGPEQRHNPLCEDGWDNDVSIHLRCYNSGGARRWREQRRASDPAYDRYCRLMTQREPIQCADCGAALDLSPKAVGMGAGVWAVNCTECHRTAPKSFLGYGATAEGWSELESIRADFVRSRRFDETDRRVREVALVFDRFVDAIPCACGGRFSLSAKPRCPRCGHVAFDTYFHVVNERLSKERLKRLNQLFGRG